MCNMWTGPKRLIEHLYNYTIDFNYKQSNISLKTRNAWQSLACSPRGINAVTKLTGCWTKRHQFRQK